MTFLLLFCHFTAPLVYGGLQKQGASLFIFTVKYMCNVAYLHYILYDSYIKLYWSNVHEACNRSCPLIVV